MLYFLETDHCLTLYEHGSFTGKSQTFGIGKHDIGVVKSVNKNTVNSFIVQPGYKVRLFEHSMFKGISHGFGPGEHDIDWTEFGFENDTISSLVVQKYEGKVNITYLRINIISCFKG